MNSHRHQAAKREVGNFEFELVHYSVSGSAASHLAKSVSSRKHTALKWLPLLLYFKGVFYGIRCLLDLVVVGRRRPQIPEGPQIPIVWELTRG